MNLNPLTWIEKLINEHGSATILGERNKLLIDKFSILSEQNASLVQENASLKRENQNFKCEILVKDKKIQELQDRIDAFHKNSLSNRKRSNAMTA